VGRFFQSDLETHFEVEEKVVFQEMRGIEEARSTIEELSEEHGQIRSLVDQMHRGQGRQLASLLQQFADLLEAHIRKEERVLFPCYEQNLSSLEAERVRTEVLELIGTAMKPKNPVLLE